MVDCRIPGHITGLYIFAVVNLCALLNLSLVGAEVLVIDTETNRTIDSIRDKQAMFGPDFPKDGIDGPLQYVIPHDACSTVKPPPYQKPGVQWIALIARGPCHFDEKVLNVQRAGFSAAIVHNFEGNNAVMPMAGDSMYSDSVNIPSVFVGYADGMDLALHYNYTRRTVLVKIWEYDDEPLTNYFWPFTVVVSICFLGIIVFSIVKCVKYFQHRRRTRLSKRALKKIPIRKYKKGDHYDTCAICLEDYEEGEKLRVLPCDHTYHCKCIDPWLTKRKKTCPQCKRRVIPGQDTDTESENEEEGGATENTPLLGNNNTRTSAPAGQQRARTSTFDRSGLPAAVQPEVVMISEGRVTNTAATVRGDDDDDDNTESDDEQLVGAVGGVGISDQQGFVEDAADVIVVVEPAHHDSDDADLVVAEQTPTTDAATDRHSPARAEGSINCAYTPSSSSEEEVNVNSQGRKGRKKKQRKNNQVV